MSQSEDTSSPARSPTAKSARPETLGALASTHREVPAAGAASDQELAPPSSPPSPAASRSQGTDDTAVERHRSRSPSAPIDPSEAQEAQTWLNGILAALRHKHKGLRVELAAGAVEALVRDR